MQQWPCSELELKPTGGRYDPRRPGYAEIHVRSVRLQVEVDSSRTRQSLCQA